MTTWWVSVEIPGWIASRLVSLPETSAVTSRRKLVRFTDNTLDITSDLPTGSIQTSSHVISSEETTSISLPWGKETVTSYHLDNLSYRTTDGILSSSSSTTYHIHVPEGTIEIHMYNATPELYSPSWTAEMIGNVPDSETFLHILRKHISRTK